MKSLILLLTLRWARGKDDWRRKGAWVRGLYSQPSVDLIIAYCIYIYIYIYGDDHMGGRIRDHIYTYVYIYIYIYHM